MEYYVAMPFIGLSALSSFLIVITSFVYPQLRTSHPHNFIFILCLLNFLWNFVSLIPYQIFKTHQFCIAQGFLNQFFNLSGLLWTAFISLENYSVCCKGRYKESYGFYKILIRILVLSAISAFIPLVFNDFGVSQGWCWIEDLNKENYLKIALMRFFCFYLFVYIVLIWNAFCCVKVHSRQKIAVGFDEVKRLRLYPMVLIVCYLPITIISFMDGIVDVPIEFVAFSSCAFMSEGFLNVIVYALDKDFKRIVLGKRKQSALNSGFEIIP